MDPGLKFAQALLDQLRRDLKRFAPREMWKADAAIGRSAQYLRRVNPAHLKLDEAFGAIRFLGFKPSEYFDRLSGRKILIPFGALGVLKRHRILATDRIRLKSIRPLLRWASAISVETGGPDHTLDLPSRLKSLGIDQKASDQEIIEYADHVFGLYSRYNLPVLGLESARGLIRALLLLEQVLPHDRAHLRAAAELLDLGFHLEYFLGDLHLRQQLFSAGARVSGRLGFPFDEIWFASRAAELALWTSGFESARASLKHVGAVFREHGLPEELWCEPVAGSCLGRSETLSNQGRSDQRRVLAAVDSDRATAVHSVVSLDSILGTTKAFARARAGNRSLTVVRWASFTHQLRVTPEAVIERVAMLDMLPLKAGGLLQGLKVAKDHRPQLKFQKPLLEWSRSVSMTPSAPLMGFLPEAYARAHQDPFFQQTIDGLERFSHDFPTALTSGEARRMCDALLRAGIYLSRRSRLDDAVDFVDAALHLSDKLEVTSHLAFAYRIAGSLAINLGELEMSGIFFRRSRELELSLGSQSGLVRAMHAEGIVADLSADYRQAEAIFQACLKMVVTGEGELSAGLIHLSLGVAKLHLGELAPARHAVSLAEQSLGPIEPSERSELLMVKSEILSRSGVYEQPLELLGEAARNLHEDLHARDLALIGLEKCAHLLRFGQTTQAREEARSLLRLSARLEKNPIGQRALMEIARLALVADLDAAIFSEAKLRVRYPNLFKAGSNPASYLSDGNDVAP